MHQLQILSVIAFTGALGALARYASVQGATYLWGDRFPYGTLLVNVVGCLVIGVASAALMEPHKPTAVTLWLRYGLMVFSSELSGWICLSRRWQSHRKGCASC